MHSKAGKEVRVLIVDDHPIVRTGLVQMIREQSSYRVVGEAADAHQAMETLDREEVDIAIVDISLGGISGLELIKMMRSQHPEVPILVLSMHDETLYAERVLRAGARGYIEKSEATERLLGALEKVLRGQIYLSESMTSRLLDGFLASRGGDSGTPLDSLSDRELEVYELVGRGLSTRQIAEKLNLSVKTVEAHREHIKGKLKLKNATELLRHATQWVLGHKQD